ncbi:MAG: hypothetical protein H7X71_06985 [Chitinophagales bacterium]|nr:hypothetical protein [Chitinophagales bacterium]
MIQQIATSLYARVAVYLFFAAALIAINYFTPRTNFIQLISLYAILFGIYLYILFYWKDEKIIREAKIISVVFRVFLLFSIPNLSDDFYRFIWDGRISAAGFNPYLYTPQQIAEKQFYLSDSDHLTKHLFDQLNSQAYFTVYPPVPQFIFLSSHILSGEGFFNDIYFLRTFIILAETGTIYLLPKILAKQNLPSAHVLLYALNPLIIIELTGNLHFEAVMIFFLVIAIYFLLQKKYLISATAFGFAIATKLWPLMLLPFFIRYIGWKRSLVYACAALGTAAILYVPFYNEQILGNMQSSLQLYFSAFEFNAGLYYFFGWLTGFRHETRAWIQIILPFVVLISVVIMSLYYKKEKLFDYFLFVFLLYFLCATTVHPWYIAPLIFFACLTHYKFPVIWSFLIFFTYIAYQNSLYRENYFITGIEYILLASFLFYEYRQRKKLQVRA